MSWEIALTAGMIGTAFCLLYIGFNLDKEHRYMKLFLLFIGLFMLMSNFGYTTQILNANNDSINDTTITQNLNRQAEGTFDVFMTVIIISLTYFIFYIFYKLITGYKERKKDEQEE